MTPDEFQRRCERIVHRSDELEFNSRMWFRARNASLRVYNARVPQERAIAQSVRALVHYQLVILHTLWETETKTNKHDKASIPLTFGWITENNIECLASRAATNDSISAHSFEAEIARKQNDIRQICKIVRLTQRRFRRIIRSIKIARNDIIAHNLISAAHVSFNIYELRWFSTRTARICRMIAKIHDGPLSVTVRQLWPLQKDSIHQFWSLVEGGRAGTFSDD